MYIVSEVNLNPRAVITEAVCQIQKNSNVQNEKLSHNGSGDSSDCKGGMPNWVQYTREQNVSIASSLTWEALLEYTQLKSLCEQMEAVMQ